VNNNASTCGGSLFQLEDHKLSMQKMRKEVREKTLQILYNLYSLEKTKLDGGRAKLLVRHDLGHDYDYLEMTYTNNIIRDATEARPLAKTNIVIYSLKYLIINI
jgi:RNA exonuclease 4